MTVLTENAKPLAAIKEAITEMMAPYQSKEHGKDLTALKAEINAHMDEQSREFEPLPFRPKLMLYDGFNEELERV